ncbi:hypothetical protein GF324_01550 [bacterium]|nr:hypothetical protein [bacterium]
MIRYDRMDPTVMTKQPAGRRKLPSTSRRGVVVALLAGFIVVSMLTVHIGVMRVSFGKELEQLRQRIAVLDGDVLSLKQRCWELSALASMERAAREMGMVEASRKAPVLQVKVKQKPVSTLPEDILEGDMAFTDGHVRSNREIR